MEEKEKKKEELIGKLLGRYANQKGLSIIKIGEDSVTADVNSRLQKTCNIYKTEVNRWRNKYEEAEKLFYENKDKNKKNIIDNEELIIKVDVLKKEIKDLTNQLGESNEELKIRRQEDNRFDILDL